MCEALRLRLHRPCPSYQHRAFVGQRDIAVAQGSWSTAEVNNDELLSASFANEPNVGGSNDADLMVGFSVRHHKVLWLVPGALGSPSRINVARHEIRDHRVAARRFRSMNSGLAYFTPAGISSPEQKRRDMNSSSGKHRCRLAAQQNFSAT